jgi:hypothetical protein
MPQNGAVLRPAPRPVRRWVGPAAGVSAAAVVGWGLTTPALWLDESATVIATRRDWPAFWHLMEGPEAPLVPFYLLERAAVATTQALLPDGAAPPELLYRLPSVVAAVLAVWVLAAWLSRLAGRGLAAAATGVLLLLPTFTRYGQEARPYAVTLAAAVIATVAWARLIHLTPSRGPLSPTKPGTTTSTTSSSSASGSTASTWSTSTAPTSTTPGSASSAWSVWSALTARFADSGRAGRRPVVLPLAGYAAAVTVLALAQVLAVMLVAAHLAAAAAAVGPLGRRRALRRTAAGVAAGLLPVLPFAAVSWVLGKGPITAPPPPTPGRLAEVVFLLLAEPGSALAGAAVLLAAALGATRVRSVRHGDVARVALAWALVPPAVLLAVAFVQPNLLNHRYLVFTVPGWAILAGLGVVTAAERARRAARARRLSWNAVLVTGAVVASALVATAVLQGPGLAAVRGPDGHGEDIRPALRAAGADGRADVPLVVNSRGAAELVPYAPGVEPRLLGAELQRTTRTIWPVKDTPASLEARLRDHPRVVLLLRGEQSGVCGWRAGGPASRHVARYVTRCMPAVMREQGYRVVHAEATGRRWTMALLTRPSR